MNLISEEKSSNLNFSLSYVLREIKIDCKDLHHQNTVSPMLVTESGMVTDCKDLQPSNAPSPILVTESGMIKLFPFDKYKISFCLSEVYRLPSNIVK